MKTCITCIYHAHPPPPGRGWQGANTMPPICVPWITALCPPWKPASPVYVHIHCLQSQPLNTQLCSPSINMYIPFTPTIFWPCQPNQHPLADADALPPISTSWSTPHLTSTHLTFEHAKITLRPLHLVFSENSPQIPRWLPRLPRLQEYWDTPVQPVHSDAVQALAGGTLSALKPPPTGRCWWKQKGLQIYVLKFLTDSQILLFSDYSKTNNILEFLIIHCLINTALMKTLHQLYIYHANPSPPPPRQVLTRC